MFLLLSLDNMLLLEALESKRFVFVVYVLYQLHPAETPNTKRCYYIQIIQMDVVIFWAERDTTALGLSVHKIAVL